MALAIEDNARPVICVLGMHRSGTSLCANVLHALGVNMASDPGTSPDNRRGHWERPRVNDLHDQVFTLFGRAWSSAAHVLALPPHWLEDPRLHPVRAALVEHLAPMADRHPAGWGVKDPRMARLMPLWRQVCAAIGVTPRFVFCVRDPAQVARSLAARDRLGREQAEYRWLIYNADAVAGVGANPVCIIPYEHWFDRPADTAARLAAWVGAAPPDPEHLATLIDQDLRHDVPTPAPAKMLARRLHRLLAQAPALGRFDADTRNLCACIAAFEQQVQPLLVETEILRVSVADQNRVIADLNEAIRQLRADKLAKA